MRQVLLGLGASLGDKARYIELALQRLNDDSQIKILRISSLWASDPIGPAKCLFYNAVVLIKTKHSPFELLRSVQRIEQELGRKRLIRWGDRVIDIDILLYADRSLQEEDLCIPHPEMLNRSFVLLPAKEIAEDFIHPVVGRSLHLIDSPKDQGTRKIGYFPVAYPYKIQYFRSQHSKEFGMQIFLDTANINEIKEAYKLGVIDGVTTNPSLIAKNGGDFIQTIYDICELVQGPVSAETVSQDTDGMVKEGRLLAGVHEHIVVKIPLTAAGIAATKILSDENIKTNVTLCFQASQALLAAKAGATYISPFLGRLDDISQDGVYLIEQIRVVYDNYDFDTKILAASIRHPKHFIDVAIAGADVVTLPYAPFQKLLKHPLTDSGNEKFLKDWEGVPNNDIVQAVGEWQKKRYESSFKS